MFHTQSLDIITVNWGGMSDQKSENFLRTVRKWKNCIKMWTVHHICISDDHVTKRKKGHVKRWGHKWIRWPHCCLNLHLCTSVIGCYLQQPGATTLASSQICLACCLFSVYSLAAGSKNAPSEMVHLPVYFVSLFCISWWLLLCVWHSEHRFPAPSSKLCQI